MKILCNLVKRGTYHELKFVDGDVSLIPVTWARWVRLPNLLDVQGRWMQQLLAVKSGRWFLVSLLSLWSYLENEDISFAFLSPSCTKHDATIGRISLSGYCSLNVGVNFGCILFSFWFSVFQAYLNPNLTNFQA